MDFLTSMNEEKSVLIASLPLLFAAPELVILIPNTLSVNQPGMPG